jgi:hypothetical protein
VTFLSPSRQMPGYLYPMSLRSLKNLDLPQDRFTFVSSPSLPSPATRSSRLGLGVGLTTPPRKLSPVIFIRPYNTNRSRGGSGSIVSDYGLDDRAIGVRSPAGAKDFPSSLCVQTGSGAYPPSCTMGTGGTFPGGKSAAGA